MVTLGGACPRSSASPLRCGSPSRKMGLLAGPGAVTSLGRERPVSKSEWKGRPESP